jgi:hypothetical protein
VNAGRARKIEDGTGHRAGRVGSGVDGRSRDLVQARQPAEERIVHELRHVVSGHARARLRREVRPQPDHTDAVATELAGKAAGKRLDPGAGHIEAAHLMTPLQ